MPLRNRDAPRSGRRPGGGLLGRVKVPLRPDAPRHHERHAGARTDARPNAALSAAMPAPSSGPPLECAGAVEGTWTGLPTQDRTSPPAQEEPEPPVREGA